MTTEIKAEKTLEQRVADLEAKLTDEALIKKIDPIVCGLVAMHSAEIVKIGVKDIACDVGRTIVRPITWAYEKVTGLFTKTAPAVQTPAQA